LPSLETNILHHSPYTILIYLPLSLHTLFVGTKGTKGQTQLFWQAAGGLKRGYVCGMEVSEYKASISSSSDEVFENFEELGLGDFAVAILVDGLDELVDLLCLDVTVAAQTLEGVVDEAENLIALQGAGLVLVVLAEDGIDCLSQLVVARFGHHQLIYVELTYPNAHLQFIQLQQTPTPQLCHSESYFTMPSGFFDSALC
jgi:hypothetical protein